MKKYFANVFIYLLLTVAALAAAVVRDGDFEIARLNVIMAFLMPFLFSIGWIRTLGKDELGVISLFGKTVGVRGPGTVSLFLFEKIDVVKATSTTITPVQNMRTKDGAVVQGRVSLVRKTISPEKAISLPEYYELKLEQRIQWVFCAIVKQYELGEIPSGHTKIQQALRESLENQLSEEGFSIDYLGIDLSPAVAVKPDDLAK